MDNEAHRFRVRIMNISATLNQYKATEFLHYHVNDKVRY